MIPEQLDLFGRPPRPPKKILADDEEEGKTEDKVEAGDNEAAPSDESEHLIDAEAEHSSIQEMKEQQSNGAEVEPEIGKTGENLDKLAHEAVHVELPPAQARMTDVEISLSSNAIKESNPESIPDHHSEEAAAVSADNDFIPEQAPELAVESDEEEKVESTLALETSESEAEQEVLQPANGSAKSKEIAPTNESDPVKADRTPFKAEMGNVPADEILFRRQYYSMRETSTMLGISQSLLRFWENEFDILRPRKNRKGDRYFRPVDIKNLQLIIHLLKVRLFTLDGAREYLRTHNKALDNFEVIQKLEKLKGFLHELKAHL